MNHPIRFPYWFLIILLAAFAVGYWTWSGVNWNWPEYSWNQGKSPLSVVEGWKTYRNEEYGFEFKYPSSWISDLDQLSLGKTVYFSDDPTQFSNEHGFGDYFGERLDFSVESNKNLLPLQDWIDENTGCLEECGYQEINISGTKGILMRSFNQDYGQVRAVYLALGDKVFNFSTVGEQNINILDQILSTFRFIE